MYDTHRVSVKIAAYSSDANAVLIMLYGEDPDHPKAYGLPGGHIDGNEQPDEALERELQEELGITIDVFEHRDFFRKNHDGDLVLAYSAVVDGSIVMQPPHPEVERAVWMSRAEVEQLDALFAYKDFILRNWPRKS